MRTVSIFKNGNNRAIHLPRNLDFDGVNEPEITHNGDCLTLQPITRSLLQEEKAVADFLTKRVRILSVRKNAKALAQVTGMEREDRVHD